ncbi:MAG TPA: 30S ribosomal protein S16 [Elusimicrobia bacterium]|nr:30S ribosomal protein S16 [Elusimicrobiota bacterium]
MAVSIRLQRIGKPKQAHYRLVAVVKTRGQSGTPLEVLGSYNPRGEKIKDKLQINVERVAYWLKNGAQPSDTARTLLKTYEKQQKQEAAGAKA